MCQRKKRGRGIIPRPRYGIQNRRSYRRARACPSPCQVRGKPDRTRRAEHPRPTEPETIAGDRPPRYGIRNGFSYRRARACPSPCQVRGGNPLGRAEQSTHALRSLKRSRGTGPRATVSGTARFIVGRGPVSCHPECLDNSRGTGPRNTVGELRPFCRSRSPDLDPIAIRRSQTTEEESARACPSPCCVNRKIARDRPSRYGPGRKKARGTGPRATVIERSRGTGPRATFISFSSPHQTSSASDLPRKQDQATTASLMSPAYHQTRLPQSDSNTQPQASQTYP